MKEKCNPPIQTILSIIVLKFKEISGIKKLSLNQG